MRRVSAADFFERFGSELESRPFRPHRWLRSGHLQTIVASRQQRCFGGSLESTGSMIHLRDGTAVRVDEIDASAGTAVIVLHGMSGSSRSTFVRALAWKARVEGWGALLPDLYDVSDRREEVRIFHAASNEPVGELIELLLARRSREKLFLIGASMSGNILLRLLARWGPFPPVPVVGAAVISPLVDLDRSWHLMESRQNWIYRRYYVSRLKNLTRGLRSRLGSQIDWERLDRVATVREFDAAVTVPLSEYDSVEAYYREGSALPEISRIRIPTLILHSRDDPFLPWQPLTHAEGPGLLLHLTDRGGHVAFIEDQSTGLDCYWAENRVIDFFRVISRSRNLP